MKKWIGFILVAGALAYPTFKVYRHFRPAVVPPPPFKTALVERGDILEKIDANGTVEPEELINVGAQIAGQIMSFGVDANGKTVDYGSIVEAGMVLARIDDSLYKAEVSQAKAQVAQAEASIRRAEADIVQLDAKFDLASRDWDRAQRLWPSKVIAQSAYDSAKSAHDIAHANLVVGKAALAQEKGSLAYAQAVLERAQRNLNYCVIKSPVKGVVIDRRVNIGQTVVASLEAPSVFLIAKDLTRMQVWAAVNEADIDRIKPGQTVTFTVDAFPGETFHGRVGKVRLNASMTNNVVTYTVEINADNANGRLLPYLTANVNFHVAHREKVLLVPISAIRWTPNASERPKPGKTDKKAKAPARQRRVWTLDAAGAPVPIDVKAGVSDGAMVEVEGDGLREGLPVIVGRQTAEAAAAEETVNPFTPKMPPRKRH